MGPVAYGAYPNGLAIFLGFITMVACVWLLGVKVINESGRFDIFTELYMKIKQDSPLHDLKKDTKEAFARLGIEEVSWREWSAQSKEILSNPKQWFSKDNKEVKPENKELSDEDDDLKKFSLIQNSGFQRIIKK